MLRRCWRWRERERAVVVETRGGGGGGRRMGRVFCARLSGRRMGRAPSLDEELRRIQGRTLPAPSRSIGHHPRCTPRGPSTSGHLRLPAATHRALFRTSDRARSPVAALPSRLPRLILPPVRAWPNLALFPQPSLSANSQSCPRQPNHQSGHILFRTELQFKHSLVLSTTDLPHSTSQRRPPPKHEA